MAALVLAIALAAGAGPASDQELAARLQFLEARLDEDAERVQLWWSAWMGVYVIGIAFNSFNLLEAQSPGLHANAGLGIGKAVIGIGELLWSIDGAVAGTTPLQEITAAGSAGVRQKVARAEQLLRRNAARAELRWHWLPHVINAALNVGAALIVWLGFGEPLGLAWGALSLTVGEGTIFSYPWLADDDRDAYAARFGWAFE